MNKPILDSRREVAKAIVRAFPGGPESAAARLGYDNLKRFENHLYETAGSKPLSDGELSALESDTGTTYLPDYLCAQYSGVFVKLPDTGELDNVCLHERSLLTSAKRGQVDQLIIQSLLNGGEIDDNEAREILAVHAKHMASRHEYVSSVIALNKAK